MKSILGVGNLPFAIPLPNDVRSLIPKSSATKTIKFLGRCLEVSEESEFSGKVYSAGIPCGAKPRRRQTF